MTQNNIGWALDGHGREGKVHDMRYGILGIFRDREESRLCRSDTFRWMRTDD